MALGSLAIALGGCGGSDDAAPPPSTQPGTAPAPSAAPPRALPESLLINASELPRGFKPLTAAKALRLDGLLGYKTPGANGAGDELELQRAAFRVAMIRTFGGPGRDPGSGLPQAISVVVRLGGSAQARDELARVAKAAAEPGTGNRPFPVPGVPGAKGVRVRGKTRGRPYEGFFVQFAAGPDLHRLLLAAPPSTVTVAQVAAAVRRHRERLDAG